MELDGETQVHLTDNHDSPQVVGLIKRWNGHLTTDGALGVLTVDNDVLIELPVGRRVKVEVWSNDPTEPDIIWVAATSDG